VVCGDVRLTYREFAERARALADRIRAAGGRPGDRVAIRSANCHRFLEAYWAAAIADAVLVPVNARLAEREVEAVLADAGARWLVDGEDVRPLATGDAAPADPAVAHLYYTSGTTGRPKGVILTHANVWTHALGAVAELGLSDRDRWAHVAPLYHLADAWATFAVTMVGGRHVVVPKFEPAAVLDAFRREGVTITNLVPTMLGALVSEPGAGDLDYPALRLLLSGGAPIAPRLVRDVMDTFGAEYVQTYGLTETSPYLTLSLLKEHLRALPEEERFRYRARTGRPFVTVELRVVDAEGRDVPADDATVGEIRARGPNVSPGYWNRPEETAAAFEDGWLKTGDLAVVDAEGYLNIVDRKKDMIVTGGENVYSTEVENVLYEHPAVLEAAVFGVPDDRWGEAVRAAVALRPGARAAAEEIAAFCRGRLADYKIPRAVEVVDALPKTGTGKIRKEALREPFWEGRPRRVN
jgi:acyl-CoA synthetase (AMP-forming)/AMP-acid ligase II